jgi:cytidyltransferase-like protein
MRVSVISGYFNPIHSGHIDYIRSASLLGDALIVIVNNDSQVEKKGSSPFQDEEERVKIVQNIKGVSRAIVSVDNTADVCNSLRLIHSQYKDDPFFDEMVFCNGGDRKEGGVPEDILTKELGIRMVYNVGGEKTQSSSNLISRAKNNA